MRSFLSKPINFLFLCVINRALVFPVLTEALFVFKCYCLSCSDNAIEHNLFVYILDFYPGILGCGYVDFSGSIGNWIRPCLNNFIINFFSRCYAVYILFVLWSRFLRLLLQIRRRSFNWSFDFLVC